MTMWDGLFQGIIQGATEFLPVSSDGHLTLYQHLTGNAGQGALFFNLMLHLGTLLAVFLVYYKDIWQLICAFFKMLGEVFTGKFHFKTQDENRRMIYMLFLACLPLLGFVLLKDWVTMITEDDDIVVEGFCFLWTAVLLFLASRTAKGQKNGKADAGARCAARWCVSRCGHHAGHFAFRLHYFQWAAFGVFQRILCEIQLHPWHPGYFGGQRV